MVIVSKNRFRTTALFVLMISLITLYAYFLTKQPTTWNPQQPIPNPPAIPNAAQFKAATPMNGKENPLITDQGWVLVLPALKTAQDAQRQVLALQKKGFRAYTQAISKGEENSWGIFIGPELDKATLKAIAQQLQPTPVLEMQIIPFNPLT